MSTSGDDPFRPPSDDDRRAQSERPTDPQSQSGQADPSSWGWGQQQGPPNPYGQGDGGGPYAQGGSYGSSPSGQSGQGWGDQSGGYGAPGPYGQYGQPPYGQQPAYGGYYASQDHPKSTTALVAGLVSLIGGFICGLPLLAAPYAMIVGRRAVKEIDTSQGRLGGRGPAMAGYVMGIIGTVLLALGLILVVLFGVLIATTGFS